MLRVLAILVIVGPASGAAKPKGEVSQWDAFEVADFFYQNAGVKVDATLIAEANIQGDDLFDGLIDETVLSVQLGVTRPLDQKKILKVIHDLDKSVSDAPSSLWDWRAANLRLCDMWLIPLYSTSPSFLLIWSRYFDTSEGVLDALDDPVDKCGVVWFWTSRWLPVESTAAGPMPAPRPDAHTTAHRTSYALSSQWSSSSRRIPSTRLRAPARLAALLAWSSTSPPCSTLWPT